MARVIQGLVFDGAIEVPLNGTVAFTCPADKKWIISKLTTRIVVPASSIDFSVAIFDADGFEIFRVFDKGSMPAQTSAEDINEARGMILSPLETLRLLAKNSGFGTQVEAALDMEEVDA